MSAFDDPDLNRAVLEILPVGLCVVDTQKRIVVWSDGAERITGHRRHEVLGHACISEAILHCDQPGCEFCPEDCPLGRAMKLAQPVHACAFVHHKAGHQVPVRARVVPLRNSHGSIIGAVEVFDEAQSARRGLLESFDLPESIDEVTGLASRAWMESQLRQALEAFAVIQDPFAVLCFRMEGLEHFRASFGHEAASSLLHVVSRTLEGALWKTDFVGRWEENEFLAILIGCQEQALQSVRDRVQRLLADSSIVWWGERRSLPISIGYSTARSGDSVESLLQRANQSLNRISDMRAGTAGPNGDRVSGS